MDERQRLLERRWKETGSEQDQAVWLRDRVRSGDLTDDDLRLLMLVGHRGARLAAAGHLPDIPSPKNADGETLLPGEWTKRTNGAEASSRLNVNHAAVELQLRYHEFNVSEQISDQETFERLKTAPPDVIKAQIIGRLEAALRQNLAEAGRLPLIDLAYAADALFSPQRLILMGYLVAQHTLPLYERFCAGNVEQINPYTTVSSKIEAKHPDGRTEAIPMDGDHLSEDGMIRFNIPTTPRSALRVVAAWLDRGSLSMDRLAIHFDHLRLFMADPPPRQVSFPDGPPNMVLMLLHMIRRLNGVAPFVEEPWPYARYLGNIFREGREWTSRFWPHAPGCMRPQGSSFCRCGLHPGDRWLVNNVIRPGLAAAILGEA